MSIFTGNCRGLGNLRAVLVLKNLIRDYKSDAIFIFCETLVNANKIEEIRLNLGFENDFEVYKEGRSGGVAIIWRSNFHCSIISYAKNYVNKEVVNEGWGLWCFTRY